METESVNFTCSCFFVQVRNVRINDIFGQVWYFSLLFVFTGTRCVTLFHIGSWPIHIGPNIGSNELRISTQSLNDDEANKKKNPQIRVETIVAAAAAKIKREYNAATLSGWFC